MVLDVDSFKILKIYMDLFLRDFEIHPTINVKNIIA